MNNHRLWDNPAFLKSAFDGGFHTSAAQARLRPVPRFVSPRSAFAATSPYAAFIPVHAVSQRPAPSSLMGLFGRGSSPASMRALAAQRSAVAPVSAPKPRLPVYTPMPVTPMTMEIRRNHGPIVPRGID